MTTTAKRVASEEVPLSDSPFVGAPNLTEVTPSLPKSKADTELILKSLLVTYVGIGQLVSVVDMADGLMIVRNAEDLTESWRQLLDSDPKLRRIMKRVIQGSGWGAVLTAHFAVAAPIIQNHRDKFSHLFQRKFDVEQPHSA